MKMAAPMLGEDEEAKVRELGAESCVFRQTDAAPAAMCFNGVVHYTHHHPGNGAYKGKAWRYR